MVPIRDVVSKAWERQPEGHARRPRVLYEGRPFRAASTSRSRACRADTSCGWFGVSVSCRRSTPGLRPSGWFELSRYNG